METTRQEWEDFDWTQVGNGELWCLGGSDALWTRTVFPRIQRYLQVERGLEIAAGFGRLAHHLRDGTRTRPRLPPAGGASQPAPA